MLEFTLCNTARSRALWWAEGRSFRLPADIACATPLPAAMTADGRLCADQVGVLDPVHAERLRMLRAFTPRAPNFARLPISYQVIPGAVRSALASMAGRRKRRSVQAWAQFPCWPLDLSADLLADLAGQTSPFASGATPVLISHDLDSPEGLKNLVDHFLSIEEAVGARSANYIVPCAWPIDHNLLGAVHARGHEVGIHGYDHSNRTPFADTEERSKRLAAARGLIERYGVTGYRAPSLLRTRELLDGLAAHYQYDSSIPTSGGLFPLPNNGCASARPFMIGALPEIPLSLPRDGSLRFLGYRPAEILRIWQDSADAIARSGGVVSLLTHCEVRFSGNPAMLAVYRDFLAYLRYSDRFFFASTGEVLARAQLRKTGAPDHAR